MKFGNAQSWIYVTRAADDAKIYIRLNPVFLPNSIKVWVVKTGGKIMLDKDGVEVLPGGDTRSLVEFDCLNQKYRIYSLADLDSNGNVIDDFDLNGYNSPWYPIVPNSVYEKVLLKACELYY
jgi:hypothetical protein